MTKQILPDSVDAVGVAEDDVEELLVVELTVVLDSVPLDFEVLDVVKN